MAKGINAGFGGAGVTDLVAHSHAANITPLDCTPSCTSTIITTSQYNCLSQSNRNKYNNPFIAGDKFMLQTKFLDRFSPDETNPTGAFGAADFILVELFDNDGVLVSADHTLFLSRYLNGWSGSESYQLYEIDFDLLRTSFPQFDIEGVCFSFRMTAYNSGAAETDSVLTNHFAYFPTTCKDTILIKSEGGSDCCANYYGFPTAYAGNAQFKFLNTWRYHASLRRINTEFKKTVIGTKRPSVEIDRIYQLQLKRFIPEYLFVYLSEIHLAGKQVFVEVDGVLQEFFIDDFSFSNDIKQTCNQFLGKVELRTECDNIYGCN